VEELRAGPAEKEKTTGKKEKKKGRRRPASVLNSREIGAERERTG
jgi:hypothetical protein